MTCSYMYAYTNKDSEDIEIPRESFRQKISPFMIRVSHNASAVSRNPHPYSNAATAAAVMMRVGVLSKKKKKKKKKNS